MGQPFKYILIFIWFHKSFEIDLCLADEVYYKDNLLSKMDLSTVEC
jgi:hypothetical protein